MSTVKPVRAFAPRLPLFATAWLTGVVWAGLLGCAGSAPRDKSANHQITQQLRAACDSLVARQRPTGVFMERDAAWWQVGFCTRALVAGYEVTGDRRYLKAAEAAMDALEAQQLYNGSWAAYCKNTVSPQKQTSYNLADLGCVTTSLSVLSSYVEAAKAQRYREAHLRYAQFASQHDLGGWAFSNGWYLGQNEGTAYSVATATQATSFVALYRVTLDARFLRRAEQAVRFLLDDWRVDGRPTFHPHATNRKSTLDVTDFHNAFYILEALLVTFESTEDETLREEIRGALEFYLWGDRGLLELVAKSRWPEARGKAAQKSRAMLGILVAMQRNFGPIVNLDELIDAGTRHVLDRPGITSIDFAFSAIALAQLTSRVDLLGHPLVK